MSAVFAKRSLDVYQIEAPIRCHNPGIRRIFSTYRSITHRDARLRGLSFGETRSWGLAENVGRVEVEGDEGRDEAEEMKVDLTLPPGTLFLSDPFFDSAIPRLEIADDVT